MEIPNLAGQIDSKYNIIELIGIGGTAFVFLVEEKETKQIYVAKVLKRDNYKILSNEINILKYLKKCDNPYIINIIESGEGEIIIKELKPQTRRYCILEYASNGCVFDYIHQKQSGLGELKGKLIFSKIMTGIKICHENEIFNGDLKLENILFTEDFTPKICDFGFASKKSNKSYIYFGTPAYYPPEIKERKKEFDGLKADIFCLSISLMILVAGFGGYLYFKIFYRLYKDKFRNKFWDLIEQKLNGKTLSPEFKNLFEQMCRYKVDKRFTAKEVLEHQWFKEINEMDDKQIIKLENDIKDELKNYVKSVKEANKKEIQEKKNELITYWGCKSGGNNDEYTFFKGDKKLKYIYSPINMNFCIKIKGYIEPIDFMNILCYKIINQFEKDNIRIKADKETFKFNIIFTDNNKEIIEILENIIKNSETHEEIKNENEKIDVNMEKDKIIEELMLIIQVKLYKYSNDGHLLRFSLKNGFRSDFLDKFAIISKMFDEI